MAYIPSRIKKHRHGMQPAKLNLTSMMDMFTIILVFLLKTYTTEGQLLQPSDNLTLPKSTIKTAPETALDLIVSQTAILVNDKTVVNFEDVKNQENYIIEPLQTELLHHAVEAKKMEKEYGIPFSGKVTIQGDETIEYQDLVKVMATCGSSEYPNMRLIVYRKEE